MWCQHHNGHVPLAPNCQALVLSSRQTVVVLMEDACLSAHAASMAAWIQIVTFLWGVRGQDAAPTRFPAVDVFVSHNSPRGIHDKDDDVHCGFAGLTSYLRRAKPALLLHGHQHTNQESTAEGARIVGVFGHRVLDWPGARRPTT